MAQELETSKQTDGKGTGQDQPGHGQPGRARPFRLVKYFSFTGFFVILGFTLVLSFLISYQAKNLLLHKSEEYARLVAENLNHQVFQQFVIPVAIVYGRRIQLRDKTQYNHMDTVVRSTIHGFNVETVTIYDKDGVIIYSTEYDVESLYELNVRQGASAGIVRESEPYQAALAGQSTSTLVILPDETGLFRKIRRLQTFTPFIAEPPVVTSPNQILGVFETYQDLTADYREIARFQQIITGISLLFMALLFIVLSLIVRRADVIIEERNQESRRLQEQLHRSERLAALGQMVAAVSHEIRNPLGIISSTAEILNQKLKKYEPNNMLADIVVDESKRLNNIVTEFLDYARPQEPRIENCKLKDILDKNLYFLSPEIEKSEITVIRRYGGPAVIRADADHLYQAFLNIFINAIQATPRGGTIKVATTGVRGQNGEMAEIIISDTGPGIEPESRERIFNPFFTTKDKGSGLGLAIVKNIIESHKGEIVIESSEEGGARVIIHLPANKS